MISYDQTSPSVAPSPAEKTIRLSDGDGLYLLVKPNGARWWRMDYTIFGKRKTLSVGVYPDTPRNWHATTIEQFIQDINSYISWYNEKRIKISLNALSSLEYRESLGFTT